MGQTGWTGYLRMTLSTPCLSRFGQEAELRACKALQGCAVEDPSVVADGPFGGEEVPFAAEGVPCVVEEDPSAEEGPCPGCLMLPRIVDHRQLNDLLVPIAVEDSGRSLDYNCPPSCTVAGRMNHRDVKGHTEENGTGYLAIA
jgi:hypothetical protein